MLGNIKDERKQPRKAAQGRGEEGEDERGGRGEMQKGMNSLYNYMFNSNSVHKRGICFVQEGG